eukprot:10645782-Ditylum_brightwellii.AAC.1
MADVAANVDPFVNYITSGWTSPTSDAIAGTSKKLLHQIMGTQQIPYHAYAIAILPEQDHGLGHFEPSGSAISSFVVAVAC